MLVAYAGLTPNQGKSGKMRDCLENQGKSGSF